MQSWLLAFNDGIDVEIFTCKLVQYSVLVNPLCRLPLSNPLDVYVNCNAVYDSDNITISTTSYRMSISDRRVSTTT